ncbi:4-cresol dehydrogenase (hydroxylating) [Sphingobium jiangsuense]|uniref:4-cresol dehydrogenase (Hydroxylating) n=1 Tax=Sphingobium jiangsuense TaxID=870476 RepID=A0A7W6BH54_9SPHN|nr:FAD-binding oxidoreductase [Sphingobium jiangsuense]MBB3926896.1 4-cresol dehydrogenase (hydroxylating) [Sphingobium jiangsuense]
MNSTAIDTAGIARALRAMGSAIGAQYVFTTEEDRIAYSDHYSADETSHQPLGAVAPATVEEVQAIIRIANEHKVPLWTISRGKNFGYGGSAPVVKGSIVLDLSRMKKIEVDAENGTVLVEPGVSFFDLFDFIQEHKLPLWLSVPGNSWGSVAGNALDRGVGYTTYGDHAARICGLEVVLPDGDLVRTGMGAMSGSPNWQLYKPGYGPSWDTMFCQSNFGVVTKLGLWLMPEPESVLGFDIDVDKPEDLGWLIDTLAPLRRQGIIQQSPSIGNWLRAAATLTLRDEWVEPGKPLTESVITAIRKKFNIGWWGVAVRWYGPLEINEATSRVVEKAFAGKPVMAMRPTRWVKGDAPEGSPATGVPVTYPLANANWFGGRGGHVSYSPVLPVNGALALDQYRRTSALYAEYGMDYHPSFAIGERHMTNVNQLLFNRDDPDMMKRVDSFMRALVKDATAKRYAEYRTHIDYMDLIADTFDFNNHALRRLNERVKDALDPNGILSPGKSGIWPANRREKRS